MLAQGVPVRALVRDPD
ncbi:hypothetical protein AB4Z54_61570, partial [Streptomyces sp. MCAF7]